MFRQWIQSAIEQGKLKFETPTKAEKPMKIDQHPVPTNTVEVSRKDTSHVKLLTSESAQNKRVVDPKVQATTADVKGKRFLLEEEDLKATSACHVPDADQQVPASLGKRKRKRRVGST
jgi:hypothetical protein